MRVANENLVEAGPASLGADWASRPVWLGHIAQYAIQLVFTGTPDGSFKLQASNDVGHINAAGSVPQYAGVTNWTDIGNTTVAITEAGDVMWNVENTGYEWVRVVYERSASTGSVTVARVKLKGI